jgi:hypothetical protein
MKHMSILHKKISKAFDLEELKTLCMDLGVDFDSLGGQGKPEKVRELLLYLKRKNRLATLKDILPQKRPNHDWQEDIEKAEQEVLESDLSEDQQSKTAGATGVIISGGSVGQVINADNIGSIEGNFSFGDQHKK